MRAPAGALIANLCHVGNAEAGEIAIWAGQSGPNRCKSPKTKKCTDARKRFLKLDRIGHETENGVRKGARYRGGTTYWFPQRRAASPMLPCFPRTGEIVICGPAEMIEADVRWVSWLRSAVKFKSYINRLIAFHVYGAILYVNLDIRRRI